MKVIEKFADEVINSGAYEPLDRVYVINKIRGLVGDHDEEENDKPAAKQLVDLAVKNEKIPDDITSREVLNDHFKNIIQWFCAISKRISGIVNVIAISVCHIFCRDFSISAKKRIGIR